MVKENIPDQMTAIVLDSYTVVNTLRVEQRPVSQPGPNDVLVKVAATPINPSDLAFVDGLSKPCLARLSVGTPANPGGTGRWAIDRAGVGKSNRDRIHLLPGKR